MSDNEYELPKGVGQLPDWWLDNVLHDVRDDILRKKRRKNRKIMGLPKETQQREDLAIGMEKTRLDSISATSEGGPAVVAAMMAADETYVSSKDDEDLVADLGSVVSSMDTEERHRNKVNVNITNEEEAALVEARRAKKLGRAQYGQHHLRKREGNVKKVDSVYLKRQYHSGRDVIDDTADDTDDVIKASVAAGAAASAVKEETVPEEEESVTTSSVSTNNTAQSSVAAGSTQQRRTYKTEFTGVSPFDFAMQQRAKEKERREKERQAREALSTHHGASLEADRAFQHRARDEEQKRQKKEAEEALKAFKAADLDKKYEVADKLKKLQIEDKLKKKEAEEHNKGYRER